jgi:hypothetical protein
MTNHPPMFASQAADQKKWDEGFKAGIAEVLHELESASAKSQDLEGPTHEWVRELSAKITNKYL